MFDPRWMRYASKISGAVMTKMAFIVGGYFLGQFLDRRFQTNGIFTFGLMLLGFSLGLWYLLRTIDRSKWD